MKKIFTLLFCIAAMAFAANANETVNDNDLITRCMNVVLGIEAPTTNLNGINLDVNQDGRIDVSDVTLLIEQNKSQMKTQAPKRKLHTKKALEKSTKFSDRERKLKDARETIEHNKKDK